MLYDQNGRKIKIKKIAPPSIGRSVIHETSDRMDQDVTRGLTPAKIDEILTAANGGDIFEQCRLAIELEEKDWDIAHSLETRRNAVLGIEWEIEPGGDAPADIKAAEDFAAVLEGTGVGELSDTFDDLLEDMMSSLLPGFSASEIEWLPGGSGFAGFSFIDQRHFTFLDGFSPKLVTSDHPAGVELHPYKIIFHTYRRRGGDPARGGLIRPLAWLYCFKNIDFKDLLRFMERYGMPFAVAQVDKNTWENELEAVKSMIQNFGPDGGGVFTKSMEIELLQAVDTKGDIYKWLLTYIGDAITKVILGQTASSSDGGGLSGDNAQSEVRQDILEADCKRLSATVNAQLIARWAHFNLSESVKRPKMVFHCEPPEDTKVLAETVKTLHDAGFQAEEGEMSEKFGMKLTRKTETPEAPGTGNDSGVKNALKNSTALSGDSLPSPSGSPRRNDVLESGKATALSEDVGESAPAPTDALAANSLAIFAKTGALKWAAPVLNIDPDAESPLELGLKMEKLFAEDAMFDTAELAKAIENDVYAAAASGKAEKAADLISKEEGL